MNIEIVTRSEMPARVPLSRGDRVSWVIDDALVDAVAQSAINGTAVKITGAGLDRVTVRSWQVRLRARLRERRLALSVCFDANSSIVWATAHPYFNGP